MNKRVERVRSIFDSDESDEETDNKNSNFDDEDEEDNNLKQTITDVCNSLGNETNADVSDDEIKTKDNLSFTENPDQSSSDSDSVKPQDVLNLDSHRRNFELDFAERKSEQTSADTLFDKLKESENSKEIVLEEKLSDEPLHQSSPPRQSTDLPVLDSDLFNKLSDDSIELDNIKDKSIEPDEEEVKSSSPLKAITEGINQEPPNESDKEDSFIETKSSEIPVIESGLIPVIDSGILDILKSGVDEDTSSSFLNHDNIPSQCDNEIECAEVLDDQESDSEINKTNGTSDTSTNFDNYDSVNEEDDSINENESKNRLQEEKSTIEESMTAPSNIEEDNLSRKGEEIEENVELVDECLSEKDNEQDEDLKDEISNKVEINSTENIDHDDQNIEQSLNEKEVNDNIDELLEQKENEDSIETEDCEQSKQHINIESNECNVAEEPMDMDEQLTTGSENIPKKSHKDEKFEEALGKSGDVPWTELDEDTGNGSNNESDATSSMEDVKAKQSSQESTRSVELDQKMNEDDKPVGFASPCTTNFKSIVEESTFSLDEAKALPPSEERTQDTTESPAEEVELLAEESLSSPKSMKQKRVRVEDVFTDSEEEDEVDINTNNATNSFSVATQENQEQKKEKRKRVRATSINLPAIMLAFEKGWVREIVYRSTVGISNGTGGIKKADVYYYTPTGKKLRSRNEIEQHLTKANITDLTLQNFSFFKEPLGVEERFEKIRSATAKINENETEAPQNSKKRKLDSVTLDTPVAKKMHYGVEKRVALRDIMPKVHNIQKQMYQPMRMANGSAVYATHLFPCNPALTQPRILTPAIQGFSRDKTYHCTPSCVSGGGNVPNLQCVKCLCLFHPECCQMPALTLPLIMSSLAKFLCPNCYNQELSSAEPREFDPAPAFEPLAFYPSSDSEDEGVEMTTDFEHSSYKRVSLRPSTPEGFTPPRDSTFNQTVSTTNGDHVAVEGLSPDTSASGTQFYFVKPPTSSGTPPPVPPQTHFHPSTFDRKAPTPRTASPPPVVRRGPNMLGDLSSAYKIVKQIFSFLKPEELLIASRVCHMWKDAALSPSLWKGVQLTTVSDWEKMVSFLNRMQTSRVDLRFLELPQHWMNDRNTVEQTLKSPDEEILECSRENVKKLNAKNLQTDAEQPMEVDFQEGEIARISSPADAPTTGDDDDDAHMNSALSEHDYLGKSEGVTSPPAMLSPRMESQSKEVEEVTRSPVASSTNSEEDKPAKENEADAPLPSFDANNPLHNFWTNVCSSLKKMKSLESIVVGKCDCSVLEIILYSIGEKFTEISALQLTGEENKTISFDPSSLMHARNVKSLRLGSQTNFKFKSNFNFIKLPQLISLKLRGLKTAETGWPYMGTQLRRLSLSCVNTFAPSNWTNISSMTNLEHLEIEGKGGDYDSDVCGILCKLTNLRFLRLLDWNVGPKLPFTLKRLTNIKHLHITPSVDSQVLLGVNGGRLMVMLEASKHLTEFVWEIQPKCIVEEDKIYIQNMKLAKETDSVEGDDVRPVGIDSLRGYIKCRIPQTNVIVRRID